MPPAIIIPDKINELNSAEILATLAKGDGTPLGPTALDTLTLTLYDMATDTIINSLLFVDILDTGRGALDALGNLVISLESDDNSIVGTGTKEKHKALIIGTWNNGKGYTSQEVVFTVVNVNKVP